MSSQPESAQGVAHWLRTHRTASDWLVASSFTLLALLLHLVNLARPKGFVFDEVYYAKNANSLLVHGVEVEASGKPEFIVHPPVGKWLIATGIKLFGYNEFGWRFSNAVIGALFVGLFYFVARRLFTSQLLAIIATTLLSCDGLLMVHSRTALLDLALAFFLLVALLALLYGKHWLVGIALGLAIGVKWSGLYTLIAYFALVLFIDWRINQASERESTIKDLIFIRLPKRTVQYIVLPILIYLVSWSGWFLSKAGWDRQWADSRGGFFSFIPAPLRSWWHYHAQMYNFHSHLTDSHSYSANPWSWLIMGRPTSFFYASPKGCPSHNCAQEVLALGTPLLWWLGTIAVAVTIGFWISKREWHAGFILVTLASGYLPWFAFQKRTMFTFYAIVLLPALVLAITYCAEKLLEAARSERERKVFTFVIVSVTALITLNFIYFFPLFNAGILDYSDWLNRMWLTSWI